MHHRPLPSFGEAHFPDPSKPLTRTTSFPAPFLPSLHPDPLPHPGRGNEASPYHYISAKPKDRLAGFLPASPQPAESPSPRPPKPPSKAPSSDNRGMPPSPWPYAPPSLYLPLFSRSPHWTSSITIPQEIQSAPCESHPLPASPSDPYGLSASEPPHQKAHAGAGSPTAVPWSEAHSPPYPSRWIRSFPDSSRSNPFARKCQGACEIKKSRRTNRQNLPPPPQKTYETPLRATGSPPETELPLR